MKEELGVVTKWARPEYQGYFEDLSDIIKERLKAMSGVFHNMGGSESMEARNWIFRAGHEFYKELPAVVIGYFHRKGAFLSDVKDTRRLDWLDEKIGKGEFQIAFKDGAPDVAIASKHSPEHTHWPNFRAMIDEFMLAEKDS